MFNNLHKKKKKYTLKLVTKTNGTLNYLEIIKKYILIR
jgi:hypothetical protein